MAPVHSFAVLAMAASVLAIPQHAQHYHLHRTTGTGSHPARTGVHPSASAANSHSHPSGTSVRASSGHGHSHPHPSGSSSALPYSKPSVIVSEAENTIHTQVQAASLASQYAAPGPSDSECAAVVTATETVRYTVTVTAESSDAPSSSVAAIQSESSLASSAPAYYGTPEAESSSAYGPPSQQSSTRPAWTYDSPSSARHHSSYAHSAQSSAPSASKPAVISTSTSSSAAFVSSTSSTSPSAPLVKTSTSTTPTFAPTPSTISTSPSAPPEYSSTSTTSSLAPVPTTSSSSPSAPSAQTSTSTSSTVAPVPTTSSTSSSAPPAKTSTSTSATPVSTSHSTVQTTSTPKPSPSTTSTVQTSSTAAAPVYSSSAAPAYSGSSNGKRGLAYNDGALTSGFAGSNHISWGYNWGSAPSGLHSSFKYIPTLWGPTPSFTNYWEANAKAAIANGSTHIFSFNEPDQPTQCNLTPEVAAAGYKTWISDKFGNTNTKLCAPSVTNGGGSMGLTWLSNFMKACTGCKIDCINLHWYAQDIDTFEKHIKNATSLFSGKEIWVTEFALDNNPSTDTVNTFLQKASTFLDSQSSVAGYSYFMVSDGKLVTGKSPSSPLGQTYMNYAG